MFDLQVLAYQADITRVVTMLMAREGSPRTFEHIGVPEQHHSCSHHINNPKLMARKAEDRPVPRRSCFGYFLEKLKRDTPDGDGIAARPFDDSLRRRTGQRQPPRPREPAVSGRGRRRPARSGRAVTSTYPDNTPMANLLLTMLDKAGVPTPEKIGDSTEHLKVI